MRYSLDEQQCRNLAVSKRKEWLLTNGIGGFAMGTPSGVNTRRYHGLFVAATDPPATRMVLLAGIDAFVQTGNSNPVGLSSNEYPGTIYPEGYLYLRQFHANREVVWQFRAGDCEVEKSLQLHPGENAATIRYRNTGAEPFTLNLKPLVCHKPYHGKFSESPHYPQELDFLPDCIEIRHDGITLSISHPGGMRSHAQGWYYRFEHEEEVSRGLESRDDLFCPCELIYDLLPGQEAILVASTGAGAIPIERQTSRSIGISLGEALREAAERFVVRTPDRTSIIAGYPWFTDWGRDTMISLPGILLHTGRHEDAKKLLLDHAASMKDGLIPNRFTEGGGADYNTVDASLWFVNAIYKTLEVHWDEDFARAIFPSTEDLIRHHVSGTQFGIAVDPADGLLTQGEQGLQLTWMDAKIGDWVVTPRLGKPIEINGLWINALRIAEWLSERLGMDAGQYRELAARAEASFDEKFWREALGHYADTADPMDVSLRPNQVIAMSLPFASAKGDKAVTALAKVTQELLTPFGLRTLGPNEPGYKGRFTGPLPELDAAYHQGTVWPWLLGPYCTALVKLTGDKTESRRILKNARTMLMDRGIGGIAEVYDGDEPQNPGGCPWQAWSVAEILRSWVEDVGGD